MTQEERDQHEMELCGDLIPRLCDEDVWNDIEKLNVQDTITVRKEAISALKNGVLDDMFSDTFPRETFEKAIGYLGYLIPQKVMALPKLYTINDRSTNLPFLDEYGLMYLFSEREYAENALDYYTQQLRIWELKEIEQKYIYPFLGHEFYDCGAKGAIIDNGQNYSRHSAEEFIKKPDYSTMPEAERPVTNPDFIRAISMLQQERTWRANYEGKNKTLTKLEDDMICTFVKSRFLIPFKSIQPTPDSNGFSQGAGIQFAKLENDNGDKVTPIFSDWDQFALQYDLEEWNGWVIKAEELKDGFFASVVINVGTLAFVMNKNFLAQLFNIYEEISKTK